MTIPVGLFVLVVYTLHTYLVGQGDPFHLSLLVGTAAVLTAAVWMATAGVPMARCLLVVTLARRSQWRATRPLGTATWRRF